MPEGNINAEVAQHLSEHGSHAGPSTKAGRRRVEIVEILEAVLLAVVALATALSGYQAAKWDGESAREYAASSRLRVEAQTAQQSSLQYLQYNAGNLDSWLQAKSSGNEELAALLEHRFTPEYREAFDEWAETEPLTNPDAPAGPIFMPSFEDPLAEQGRELNQEAAHEFDTAVHSRATAEKYVRVTVILAAVLFLIAIGQRFSLRNVRVGINAVAGAFLVYCFVLIVIYPHA